MTEPKSKVTLTQKHPRKKFHLITTVPEAVDCLLLGRYETRGLLLARQVEDEVAGHHEGLKARLWRFVLLLAAA